MIIDCVIDWQNFIPELDLANIGSVLQYSGSLTQLLNNYASQEQLTLDLKLLKQDFCQPSQLESERLNLSQEINILQRIIVMSVNHDKPWLYARSYFTPEGVAYLGSDLLNLGNNSLGSVIANFDNSRVHRNHFEYGHVSLSEILNKNLDKYFGYNNLLARRSLFILDNKQILFNLDEVFLPALINKLIKIN
ncbi:MAG: chorismate lyase [Gammaproteobacteria bacterium]|nr:chorismate lyase [Gammaproteobacteria bacterium]